ncbi:MAG: CapA family protein [Usitatibacter sp.]
MALLFLCGDVMTGRGIDQVLPHPSKPRIYEGFAGSAMDYVALAERVNGPIGAPRDFAYVWGDALDEIERRAPDARIANLETAITTSEDAWPGKGINYRMHPRNVACLAAAKLDCCVLANNHVMDWGRRGLSETLQALRAAGIRTAGAGENAREASEPAVIELTRDARVLVFAFATDSAGIPADWEAGASISGVSYLHDLSGATIEAIARSVARHRRQGDTVVLSIHWGSNWGYGISHAERSFARALVDQAGADVVHGHSSHHPKGIEIHRGRPIFYGCGDLINDYEGIAGQEAFRPELSFLYFASLDEDSHALRRLELVPMRMRRFRLERAPKEARRWLGEAMGRAAGALGTHLDAQQEGSFLATPQRR